MTFASLLQRWRARIVGWVSPTFAQHQSFWYLLLAYSVFRLLAILVLRPGGFIAEHGPDQIYYFEIARLSGSAQLPFRDFWMEYPPLMPWLATLAYQLSLHIAPWQQPVLWFNTLFRLALLPFDVATLALVYAAGRRLLSSERALQVAVLWAMLFAPLFTLLTWFDPVTLFFLVLALYGFLSDRPILAGLGIGLGFLAKVVPAAIAPVGLLALPSNRRRALYLGSAAMAVAFVLLPPLLASPAYVLAAARALWNVSAWETVWALLEGYHGYGLVAPLAARADPAAAGFAANPSSLPWLPITIGFAAVYLLAITRPIQWRDKRIVAHFSLFSLAFFILFSKGYSPQWATYLGTLSILALPTGRGLGYALILGVLMVAEWPFAFLVFDGIEWFLGGIILLRTGIVLLLCFEALSRALPHFSASHVFRRFSFPLALTSTLVVAAASVRPSWQAYNQARWQEDPLTPFVQQLQSEATPSETVLLLQPELLERLRPRRPGQSLRLMPYLWADPAAWLEGILEPGDGVWLVYDDESSDARALLGETRQWLAHEACRTLEAQYGPVLVSRYVLKGGLAERSVRANFEGHLTLESAVLPSSELEAGLSYCVRLRWKHGAPLPGEYAVYIHLLDETGRLVAQSDIWPAVPTSAWEPNGSTETVHGLNLISGLEPGHYRLQAGLYEIGTLLPLRRLDGGEAAKVAELPVKGGESKPEG